MQKQFVRALPSPEKVAEIRQLAEDGFGITDITTMVFGLKDQGGHCRKAVVGILTNPHDFDTDVDEVAVARALQGDRAVWESLTHYERREVMIQIHDRRELERQENAEDRGSYDPTVWSRAGGWPYVAPIEVIPDWLAKVAEAIGWTAGRLGQEAKDFAQARVL